MQEKQDLFDKTTKQGRFYRSLFKIGILLAGILIAGGCYLQMQKKQEFVFEMQGEQELEESILQYETDFYNEEQDLKWQIKDETQSIKSEETKIVFFVHVCGQVKNPGVYQLEEGARIYDAIQLAGGLTEEACEEAVNLAEKVIDGEQIWIPDKAEAEKMGSVNGNLKEKQTESGLVDLNTATKEQLMTLTGIGEARAKDILAYREEYGRFQTIEDIMKVPGIKDAAFAKIKDEIVVR